MAMANQPVEANWTPKLSDAITPYPVPVGLVAASIKASKGKSPEETADESHTEATKEATKEAINSLPGVNNDGSSAFFRDVDYPQEQGIGVCSK